MEGVTPMEGAVATVDRQTQSPRAMKRRLSASAEAPECTCSQVQRLKTGKSSPRGPSCHRHFHNSAYAPLAWRKRELRAGPGCSGEGRGPSANAPICVQPKRTSRTDSYQHAAHRHVGSRVHGPSASDAE
jgi:hypothetical protein